MLHCLLHGSQPRLKLGIAGVMFQSFLVRVVCPYKIALAVQSSPLASPSFSPVGFDLSCFRGIVQGIVPLLLGGMCGGSVAVEDVVLGLELDGLGELVTGTQSA